MGDDIAGTPRESGDHEVRAAFGREYRRALGERLRAIRVQHHLTRRDVAVQSGGTWHIAVIGSYERGDRAISVTRLARLARFYGVSVTELLPPDHHATGPALDAV
jgi:hypothetical protein